MKIIINENLKINDNFPEKRIRDVDQNYKNLANGQPNPSHIFCVFHERSPNSTLIHSYV